MAGMASLPAAQESEAAATPLPRTAAVRDRITPVRGWQVVAWEAATLAAAAGWGRGTAAETAGFVGAGALVGLTSVRAHGLCLAQWADVQARYRHRGWAARRHPGAEPFAELLPDLALDEHVDRAGNRVGLARTDGGWVSAVRLGPTADPDTRTLMTVLRERFEGGTIPLACAQLVVWTAAGPARAGSAGDGEPLRVHWLALRYRTRQAPYAALARGGDGIGAARSVASAALGLVADLDAAGYSATALDRADLAQELAVAVNAAAPAPGAAREAWRDWSLGGLRQVCHVPHRTLDPADVLGHWVPRAVFTCASYTLTRTPRGKVQDEAVFRVVSDAGAADPGFGLPGVPANGRHQEFVLRTLPLAVDH